MEDKSALRLRYRQARLQLSRESVVSKSQAITKRCLELLDWSSIHSVHIFITREADNEVETHGLIETIWHDYPHAALYAPLGKDGTKQVQLKRMETFQWDGRTPSDDGTGSVVPTASVKFDVIFVPLLVFDERGHRLGYGGGYYDRFLKRQPQAKAIGLVFELSFSQEALPTESHDVALDAVVTEKKSWLVAEW